MYRTMSEKKTRNQVAAVVVTYNRASLLRHCLVALQAQSIPCDVLVVDNASTDDTATVVQQIMQTNRSVHYRNTGANLGGAGGFHFGMRWAVETGYHFVWVMDDDCFPELNALEELLDADEKLKGKYGWLSSRVLWTDGQECRMNRQKAKKGIRPIEKNIFPAEQATFVSLFLKAETIRTVGLPIKDFFIWGDDIEYTRRIAVRQKINSYVVLQSRVVHAMKENTGSNLATDSRERLQRYRYAYRNENYIYRQEGLKGRIYYGVKCLYHTARILARSGTDRGERLKILWGAVREGQHFDPKIEHIVRE